MDERRFDNPSQDEQLWDLLEGQPLDLDGPAAEDLPADEALGELLGDKDLDRATRDCWRSVRARDREIAAAMRDVRAPEGLASRILTRLTEESPASPATERLVPAGPRRIARRWLLATAATLLISLGIGALWLLNETELQPIAVAAVPESAIEFFDSPTEAEHYASGKPLTERTPPQELRPSREIRELPTVRWRFVSDFLGRRAVAYDLTERGAFRATVYVVQREPDGAMLPEIVPEAPTLQTRNRCASVWQVEDRLCVLVVEGETRHYDFLRSLLSLPNGPMV